MSEVKTPSSECPICGGNAYTPEVSTRADGTSSEGWFRCTKCKRYTVSLRPSEPHVPAYRKPYR